MSITDTDIIRQPITFVTDNIDVTDIDVPDFAMLTDTVGDVVSTVAVRGGKGVFRTLRTVKRHPKASAWIIAILVAVVAGAAIWKQRAGDDASSDSSLHAV